MTKCIALGYMVYLFIYHGKVWECAEKTLSELPANNWFMPIKMAGDNKSVVGVDSCVLISSQTLTHFMACVNLLICTIWLTGLICAETLMSLFFLYILSQFIKYHVLFPHIFKFVSQYNRSNNSMHYYMASKHVKLICWTLFKKCVNL